MKSSAENESPTFNFDEFLKANPEIAERLKQRRERFSPEKVQSIRKAYGEDLTDFDIRDIIRAQEENAICEKCEGSECPKKTGKYQTPVICKNPVFHIRAKVCKVAKEKSKSEKVRERLKFAEIPEQYRGLTFDNYDEDAKNRTAKRYAEQIAESGKKGAFFYGKYGVGKTMLAAIIANESVKRSRDVIFSKVPDLLRNVRATFNPKSEVKETDILERIYKIPVLILDDVKRERGKRFVSDTLFDIIDYRYNAGLQTIMTSNGTLEQIADALNNPTDTNGEPVENGSRIYDRCKVMMPPIEIKGESRRGKK